MKIRAKGFTLVELVVVIAIIGILAAIVLIGLSRYQADARDARRVSSVTAIAEALEKYYDLNGEYPGCDDIQQSGSTVATQTLKGISTTTLVTPQAGSGTTNSLSCSVVSPTGTDIIEYQGDGSSTCTSGGKCLAYTLRYKDESSGTIKEVQSRRTTDIATSGVSTLSLGNVSFTRIVVLWTPVENATTYDLEINGVISSVTGVSTVLTGLTKNTGYTFKIRPVGSGGPGNWSNTVSATTLNLATPAVTATGNSATAYTAAWSPITNATSYNVQCSTDNVSWGTGCQATTASTSYQFTNGTMATRYYVRAQAINTTAADAPQSGNWSSSANAYTLVTAPSSYTISSSTPAWNTLQATSNAVCTGGSVAQYVWYANGAVVSGATAVTYTHTLSWNQSVTLSVSTRCTLNGQYSSYTTSSNTASKSLPGPTAWAGNCAYRTACWDGSCPAGTTSGYINWRVNSAVQGAPWVSSNAGVGYGSWYGNAGWGDGDVRSTTYCSGPWGTVTAGGWGPFGSGCVPNIVSGWCTV